MQKAPTNTSEKLDKSLMYGNLARLGGLVATTAAVFAFYRFMMRFYFFNMILVAYLVAATAAILAYVIYNRGFSRKGLTEDMLPDTMTQEEKTEFIEDGVRRIKRSRPLLIVIFAFAFTFVYDAIELFAIPLFKGLWG